MKMKQVTPEFLVADQLQPGDLPALVAATLAAFLVGFGLNQAWTFRSRA